MTVTTDAFIIKRRTYRENDKVITFYTPQFGKIEAVAIGTKKSLSKLAGQLEPLQEVRVQLAQGKGLSRVAQVVGVKHIFQKFADDLSAQVWAQKSLALIDRLVPWKESQLGLYNTLEKYFSLMIFAHDESVSQIMAPILTIGLGWQLASTLGYKPVLNICVGCGIKIGRLGGHFFDIAGGGLSCAKCATKNEQPRIGCQLMESAKWHLSDMVVKPLENLLEYTGKSEDAKTVRNLFELFISYHFPRYVNQ